MRTQCAVCVQCDLLCVEVHVSSGVSAQRLKALQHSDALDGAHLFDADARNAGEERTLPGEHLNEANALERTV